MNTITYSTVLHWSTFSLLLMFHVTNSARMSIILYNLRALQQTRSVITGSKSLHYKFYRMKHCEVRNCCSAWLLQSQSMKQYLAHCRDSVNILNECMKIFCPVLQKFSPIHLPTNGVLKSPVLFPTCHTRCYCIF